MIGKKKSYYELMKEVDGSREELEKSITKGHFLDSYKYFIAVYTNKCKEYCDVDFFGNLFNSNIGDTQVSVVDNSKDLTYTKRLKNICGERAEVDRIDIKEERMNIRFLKNVTESALLLREKFLEGKWKYFVILESDVLPQDSDWLVYFNDVVDQADVIGGLYYKGFHGLDLWEGSPRLVETHHVLSGCALYKREVIEKIPFRWSEENLGAFPDAWCSFDSKRNGNNFKLANYTKIICDHLESSPGDRGHGRIS